MPYTTGILLFDQAEELDFVGPLEVFGMARQEGDRVVTVAERGQPVRANLGLQVIPDHTVVDAPALDVLVVPGGFGTRREADNPVLLDWIKPVAGECTWITSVCTGSMLLEAAGVIDGRKVTTHWAMIDTFRHKDTVTVLDSRRYVRDGNVVTAAGVSAGIDMSLWVVGQLYGVEHARGVQRMMEYDPAPPYAADV